DVRFAGLDLLEMPRVQAGASPERLERQPPRRAEPREVTTDAPTQVLKYLLALLFHGCSSSIVISMTTLPSCRPCSATTRRQGLPSSTARRNWSRMCVVSRSTKYVAMRASS